MRISDWSSDVCSSDLGTRRLTLGRRADLLDDRGDHGDEFLGCLRRRPVFQEHAFDLEPDRRVEGKETHRCHGAGVRKRVVAGTSVAVRVYLGGWRLFKKKKQKQNSLT